MCFGMGFASISIGGGGTDVFGGGLLAGGELLVVTGDILARFIGGDDLLGGSCGGLSGGDSLLGC